MRKITYSEAVNEALHQIMSEYENVFLIGQGLASPWYVGSTAIGLVNKFGSKRVIDTPISENTITGVALGSALAGLHPIICFPRMDFMYYAFDQIANHIANWNYLFGENIPLTIWAIINRGREFGAQHSQALQAFFTHIPCIKVVMPSTPYDAKGLLISSVREENPVVYIIDSWLYRNVGKVPEELYEVPIGKGEITKKGKDVTIVSTSFLSCEALKAAVILESEGVDVEVLDLRSIKPLDFELLSNSLKRTRRLVIADGGWKTCGVASEVSARVAESDIFKLLHSPIIRVCLPDSPAPASSVLEKNYYVNAEKIVLGVRKALSYETYNQRIYRRIEREHRTCQEKTT